MALKFLSGVKKISKLKIEQVWGLILTFGEVAGEQLIGVFFGLYLE